MGFGLRIVQPVFRRISSTLSAGLVLLIVISLLPRGSAGADDSNRTLKSFCEADVKQLVTVIVTNNQFMLLANRRSRVGEDFCKMIAENRSCFRERNALLREIAGVFHGIPLKLDHVSPLLL